MCNFRQVIESLSLNFFPKKRLDDVYILLYTSLHCLIEMVTELPTSSFNNLKFYCFVPRSTESPPSAPFAVYIHSLLRRHESTVVNGVNSGMRQAWVYILALPVPSCMTTENHLNSLCLSFLICKWDIIIMSLKVVVRIIPINSEHEAEDGMVR